jgi:hypothetical protein
MRTVRFTWYYCLMSKTSFEVAGEGRVEDRLGLRERIARGVRSEVPEKTG